VFCEQRQDMPEPGQDVMDMDKQRLKKKISGESNMQFQLNMTEVARETFNFIN
jgi:hypothetical protein